MTTLIITRENLLVDSFSYETEGELMNNLGDIVESIVGLDYTPNVHTTIDNLNCILTYQNYRDRLHKVDIDKVDFGDKDILLYKDNKSLVTTVNELMNSPEILTTIINVETNFIQYYFKLVPRYKRANLDFLLGVLKENFGLKYTKLK